MLTMPLSVAVATNPTLVSGTAEVTGGVMLTAKPAGNSDNIIATMDIAEDWHGDIEASGTTISTWIVHDGPIIPTNLDLWASVHEKITFQTFTVMGKSGTVTMEVILTKSKGTWTILSGTGELANLKGQGKLSLDVMPFTYTGQVHFNP